MDILRIAARIAGAPVAARKPRDKGRGKKPAKVSRAPKPAPEPELPEPPDLDLLTPQTEFSVRTEISIAVDFEGDVTKQALTKKLRAELLAAVKQAVKITADELQAAPSVVSVQPIRFEVAVNDQRDVDDEMDA